MTLKGLIRRETKQPTGQPQVATIKKYNKEFITNLLRDKIALLIHILNPLKPLEKTKVYFRP